MGAALDIFRLYRLSEGLTSRYVLVKAVRAAFPNGSQAAEDAAIDEVEQRLIAVLETEAGPIAEGHREVVATWEAGLPEGDCFNGITSGIDVPIWFAIDAVHPGHFVFGVHPDAASFWQSIEGLSRDGEICPITDYARPAKHVQVRFIQHLTAEPPTG